MNIYSICRHMGFYRSGKTFRWCMGVFYKKRQPISRWLLLFKACWCKKRSTDRVGWELIDGQQRLTTIYIIKDAANELKLINICKSKIKCGWFY